MIRSLQTIVHSSNKLCIYNSSSGLFFLQRIRNLFKIAAFLLRQVLPRARPSSRSLQRRCASTMADTSISHSSSGTGAVTMKLTGRQLYEKMGCPKWIVAPMVDRSEFVCFPQFRLSCFCKTNRSI